SLSSSVSFSGDGLYLISAEFSGCRPVISSLLLFSAIIAVAVSRVRAQDNRGTMAASPQTPMRQHRMGRARRDRTPRQVMAAERWLAWATFRSCSRSKMAGGGVLLGSLLSATAHTSSKGGHQKQGST